MHESKGEVPKFRNTNGSSTSNSSMVVPCERAYVKRSCNGHLEGDRCLLARGLMNPGNLCFQNASLQALLSCSYFIDLLHKYKKHDLSKVDYPTLSAFTEFVTRFEPVVRENGGETGLAFSPAMFEPVIKEFTPDIENSSASGRARQEDAQEFLSFVLNQMHDELLKLRGRGGLDVEEGQLSANSLTVSSDDNNEWETVGRNNRSAVTRTQSFVPSELSAIFGGQLRSLVTAAGAKPSATVQPFLLLHLDIFPQSVQTIDDALHLFTSTETLQDYRTGKGRVSAKKSVKIQRPSRIMILHLMRFGYGKEGSTKLDKGVHFPLELTLRHALFDSPTVEGRRYELVATITHHGKDPWKGHYTADARHPHNRWLRFDDSSVSAIAPNKVLHDQAYVLFYRQLPR